MNSLKFSKTAAVYHLLNINVKSKCLSFSVQNTNHFILMSDLNNLVCSLYLSFIFYMNIVLCPSCCLPRNIVISCFMCEYIVDESCDVMHLSYQYQSYHFTELGACIFWSVFHNAYLQSNVCFQGFCITVESATL